ncbi:MAG: hypothetical protein JXB49_18545 [Bacteroidales bacterium]|nr:hypothetical protein [Bacteroidales bacterium]
MNFDNFSVENGLNHNYIQKVFQDKKGWIWIGTSLGIERFDGYNFKSYPLKTSDTSSIGGLIARTFFF